MTTVGQLPLEVQRNAVLCRGKLVWELQPRNPAEKARVDCALGRVGCSMVGDVTALRFDMSLFALRPSPIAALSSNLLRHHNLKYCMLHVITIRRQHSVI